MNNRITPVIDTEAVLAENNNCGSWPADHEKGYQLAGTAIDLPSYRSQRSIHDSSSARKRNSIRRASLLDNQSEILDIEGFTNDTDVVPRSRVLASPIPLKLRYAKLVKNDKGNKVKRISGWKAFKLKVAMSWKSTTSALSQWSRDYELWKGHLKEVEGRFGSGVLSFFVLMKQMLFLNIVSFLLEFGLVSIPTIIANTDVNSQSSTNTCSIDQSSLENASVGDMAVDFISGKGWVNATLMFYAGYPASKLIFDSGVVYNLPLAYLLVGMFYFLIILFTMVHRLAKGLEASFSNQLGTTPFCNQVLAGWDFCITEEKTAKLIGENFVQSVRAYIAEEERKNKVKSRSQKAKCLLYALRCFISFLVFVLLGGAIYLIYLSVDVSTNPHYLQMAWEKHPRLVQLMNFAPSLTITILNVLLPFIFKKLCLFEDWSPSFEVTINMCRMVVLRMTSLVVLMITLYTTVNDRCGNEPSTCCQQNWENQIASQMYTLIWTDFFVHVFTLLVVNTIKKLLYKYVSYFRKLGLPEFDIAKEVLGLAYGECLIWIGTFFSPIMPAMGAVKLIIMFYVTKVSVMFSNKPPEKVYRASRYNYIVTVLLLLSVFMCICVVGWGVTRMRPSCIGPFSNKYCMDDARIFDVLTEEMNSWPPVVRELIGYGTTATFLFPILTVVCLMLFYFKSLTTYLMEVIETLKDQIALEGRDKTVLKRKLASSRTASTSAVNHDIFSSSNNAQQATSPQRGVNF